MIQELGNPDEDPPDIFGATQSPRTWCRPEVSRTYAARREVCGELQGEWTLYGGTTLGRTKPVGGRADMLSGKYPNKGQANTFSYFPHDAPQGLKSYPFCVRLEVSQNVCRVHEWTWAAALEISGTVIILICTRRTSVTAYCGRALCTVHSPNKTGNRTHR